MVNLSGILVNELKRRSKSFLKTARIRITWGDYDLACLDAEQALQLYLKAVLIELFGVSTRVHGVLEHLSILRRELSLAGHREEAEILSAVVKKYRDIIDLLDESYIEARYGLSEYYPKELAENAVKVVDKIIRVVEEIVKRVKKYEQ